MLPPPPPPPPQALHSTLPATTQNLMVPIDPTNPPCLHMHYEYH